MCQGDGAPINSWTMAQTVEAGGFVHFIDVSADKLLQMCDDFRATHMGTHRDSITFDEWVDLDLLDVRKRSVWTDVKLIAKTVSVVLTAQGS